VIVGAVLAAGGSRRFGEPKQLAPLQGRPLLEHALAALAAAPLDARCVVLGACLDEILAAVPLHGLEVCRCPDWEEGIAASLRAAVRWARVHEADALCVTLGDQPRIGPPAFARVLGRRGADGALAVRAAYAGKPGHPALIESALFDALLELRGDRGAGPVLAAHACLSVDCDDVASGRDVDRPHDLAALGGT
jgi:CTP:molybdopterin cytidylyltransferase MocA